MDAASRQQPDRNLRSDLVAAYGGCLNRLAGKLGRAGSLGLAAGLTALACWEQTPNLASAQARETNGRLWAGHRALAASLEASLAPAAMVFQLPVVPFPEAGRAADMPDYEHFLPYLASQTLRFSYGSLRASPGERWSRQLGREPARKMVPLLEKAGFSALWLDLRGLAGHGESLAASLRALGREELPVPPGLPVRVFRLQPARLPIPPDLDDPRLQDSWTDDDPLPGQPQMLALSGWYALEKDDSRSWRWVRHRARMGIWWDKVPRPARLSFRFGGKTGNTVILRLGDREIWRAVVQSGPARAQEITVPLLSGLTVLEWELDGRTLLCRWPRPAPVGFRD